MAAKGHSNRKIDNKNGVILIWLYYKPDAGVRIIQSLGYSVKILFSLAGIRQV